MTVTGLKDGLIGGSRLAGGRRPHFLALPSPTKRNCSLDQTIGVENQGKPEQRLRPLPHKRSAIIFSPQPVRDGLYTRLIE